MIFVFFKSIRDQIKFKSIESRIKKTFLLEKKDIFLFDSASYIASDILNMQTDDTLI